MRSTSRSNIRENALAKARHAAACTDPALADDSGSASMRWRLTGSFLGALCGRRANDQSNKRSCCGDSPASRSGRRITHVCLLLSYAGRCGAAGRRCALVR